MESWVYGVGEGNGGVVQAIVVLGCTLACGKWVASGCQGPVSTKGAAGC